jgi:hypothetical protein
MKKSAFINKFITLCHMILEAWILKDTLRFGTLVPHTTKLIQKTEDNPNDIKTYTLLTSMFILWSSSSTESGLPLTLDPQRLPLRFPPERWCPPVTRWHIFSLSSSTLINLKFPTRLCSTPLQSPLAFFATTSIMSPFCNQIQHVIPATPIRTNMLSLPLLSEPTHDPCHCYPITIFKQKLYSSRYHCYIMCSRFKVLILVQTNKLPGP